MPLVLHLVRTGSAVVAISAANLPRRHRTEDPGRTRHRAGGETPVAAASTRTRVPGRSPHRSIVPASDSTT